MLRVVRCAPVGVICSIALAFALSTHAGSGAVAQNSTREQVLADAVQVEPEEDPCLSERVVRARVNKRLARGAELSNVQVIVHVADPPRLSVLREGQVVAERRFEDFPARCNARRDAIAVAVALALERAPETIAPSDVEAGAPGPSPEGAQQGATSEPSPTPPSAITSEQTPRAEPASPERGTPTDEEPSQLALELGLHAGAAAMLEILPGLALAGVLGADLRIPSAGVGFSLSALASLPQDDQALGATIESRLLLGRVLGCAGPHAAGLAIEGCAGILAGAAFAEGKGYASTRSTELGYAALVARVALRYPADGTLSVRVALDGLLPVVRPSYAVQEQPGPGVTALTPEQVGAALGLEIALALP